MRKALLPLHLSLEGRLVVVVGGGPVARRKTRSVLETGAVVTVISPEICAELAEFVEIGAVNWDRREYRSGDLTGAWLVFAATGDPRVDDLIESEAEAQRTFCVRVSAPDPASAADSDSAADPASDSGPASDSASDSGPASDPASASASASDPASAADRQRRPSSQSAAVIRRPGVTISVGSNGKPDPRRAMAIRDAIGVALDSGQLPLQAYREP